MPFMCQLAPASDTITGKYQCSSRFSQREAFAATPNNAGNGRCENSVLLFLAHLPHEEMNTFRQIFSIHDMAKKSSPRRPLVEMMRRKPQLKLLFIL